MNQRAALRFAAPLLLLAASLPLGACRKELLSPDEERSQYDRYDVVRNQRAPQYVEDAYGHRRPNLRERLMPKD
ncbi:MAG: hypothetical protein WD749_12520 [Phycisphaerales bacterium]